MTDALCLQCDKPAQTIGLCRSHYDRDLYRRRRAALRDDPKLLANAIEYLNG